MGVFQPKQVLADAAWLSDTISDPDPIAAAKKLYKNWTNNSLVAVVTILPCY
jgi:hypothetical protein